MTTFQSDAEECAVLTAENVRLRAEVDTLSKGLCAQADNAVEAQKEEERLRADLVDASALHLADEQSIRNLERVIAGLRAEVEEEKRLREVWRSCSFNNEAFHKDDLAKIASLTADLARVTGERDARCMAAYKVFEADPGTIPAINDLRAAVKECGD